jgi:hypothetical protein
VFDGNFADFRIGGGPAGSGILVTELATGYSDTVFDVELLRFSDTDYLLV